MFDRQLAQRDYIRTSHCMRRRQLFIKKETQEIYYIALIWIQLFPVNDKIMMIKEKIMLRSRCENGHPMIGSVSWLETKTMETKPK